MKIPVETDVVIVGAGPVGATLANLCGRLGVRTLLIDQLPTIQMQPRAMALDNEALRILQLAGLTDSAFSRCVIPNVCLHSPLFGEFARMNTGGVVDGHPMLITFFQPEMERALLDSLALYPSVQLLRPLEWVETAETTDGCSVTLRRTDGSVCQVRTQFVIGADGASSPVRRSLGIGFKGSSYQEDWLVVDALNLEKDLTHVEFPCDPRRPTAHIPGPGGRQRWEFMLRAGERADDMLRHETIRDLLRPWTDVDKVIIERTAVYRFHARTASQFQHGRTFLIGDAAHVSPPFIGQGLVSGLRDAANLAWKLAWVVRGQASPRILASYHTERQPHVWAMIVLAKWMGLLVMPRNQFLAFVFHGIARLATLTPGLRALIVDIKIKPKNRFKHGLFAARSIGNRFEHGNHLVQAPLRNAVGEVLLSDDVLGQHLQLIGIGVDPLQQLSPVQRDTWHAMGGRTTTIGAIERTTESAWTDVENAFGVDRFGQGWIVAVRPDKVVIADGHPAQVDALVQRVVRLMQ